MALYLKNKHLLEAKDLFRDSEGNEREEVDIEGFKLALSHVDSQMKSLPATAQVLLPLFVFHPCFSFHRFCSDSPKIITAPLLVLSKKCTTFQGYV